MKISFAKRWCNFEKVGWNSTWTSKRFGETSTRKFFNNSPIHCRFYIGCSWKSESESNFCPAEVAEKNLAFFPWDWYPESGNNLFPGFLVRSPQAQNNSLTLRCGCLPQWCNVWSCVWKMPFWRVALHHLMLLGHVLSNSGMVWEYQILSLMNVIQSMVVFASNTLNGSQEWDAGDYCDDAYWWKDSLLPIFILEHFSHWTPIRKWRSHWPHLLLSRLFLNKYLSHLLNLYL